jgi:hypothetical protein
MGEGNRKERKLKIYTSNLSSEVRRSFLEFYNPIVLLHVVESFV